MTPRVPSNNPKNNPTSKDSNKAKPSSMNNTENTPAERIEFQDSFAAQVWAKKFNVSTGQLREAIEAVGDQAPKVEMHLKGSRSTTNAERVHNAGGDKPR